MGNKYENLLESGSGNIVQSFYDNFLKSNADFRSKAGFKMTVIRESIGKCCDWCQSLVGTYDYDSRPSDIYARHKNCTCVVVTKTERGTYQDAWSRKEYGSQRDARIARIDKIIDRNEKYKANLKELAGLYQKYNSLDSILIFGSETEIDRLQELLKLTGIDEDAFRGVLFKNTNYWEMLLKTGKDAQLERMEKDLINIANKDVIEAFKMWSGSSFENINRYLRYGIDTGEISINAANEITQLLNKIQISDDIILKRGTGTNAIFKQIGAKWGDDPRSLIGKTYSDKGLVATSPFKEGGFGGAGKNNAEIFIKAPKGTKGAYIADVAAHNNMEQEFLLQKGYNYKIMGAEYRPNKYNPDEMDLKLWVEVVVK